MSDEFAFRAGRPRTSGRGKGASPGFKGNERIARVKELLGAGHTYREIAEHLGVERGVVAGIVGRNRMGSGKSFNPAGRGAESKEASDPVVHQPTKPMLEAQKQKFEETPEDRKYRKSLGFED